MVKAKLVVLLVYCILFLYSCAVFRGTEATMANKTDTTSVEKAEIFRVDENLEKHRNWIKIYSTGIGEDRSGIDFISADMIIEHFQEVSPAKDAGMQIGDMIVSVNGIKLTNMEFTRLMLFNLGGKVLFTVSRNSQIINYQVLPKVVGTLSPILHKLIDVVMFNNQKVRLCIIIADIKFIGKGDWKSWEESTKHALQGSVESSFLYHFHGLSAFKETADLFSLVDGSSLNNIFKEYKMNRSDLVSDDVRTRIGKMTGATHMLIVTAKGFSTNGGSLLSELTERLVELESGQVLAVDKYHDVNIH